jgi:hypothetical protein
MPIPEDGVNVFACRRENRAAARSGRPKRLLGSLLPRQQFQPFLLSVAVKRPAPKGYDAGQPSRRNFNFVGVPDAAAGRFQGDGMVPNRDGFIRAEGFNIPPFRAVKKY